MSPVSPPTATLILLAYNQQDYIREAIEGAFAQSGSGLEILLSDDGSSDATYAIMSEMVAAYSGPHAVRLRRTERNAGFIAHLRAAVAEASADIVILAAGDDIPFPDRVVRTVAAFNQDPATMAMFSDIAVIGKAVRNVDRGTYVEAKAVDMLIGAGGVGKGAAYAYRKACFDWPEKLDDRFRSEDRVLPLRATMLGRVFQYTAPLVNYRELPGSLSNVLARQVDQAHQSRDHWHMTRNTLKIARAEGRISFAEHAALDIVCRLAMCSRLMGVRAVQRDSTALAVAARGVLLPLRLLQRVLLRKRFG